MAYENILYQVEDGIALITVNRPKVLNALNSATYEELRQAFLAAGKNEGVGAVILTGSGDKAFVAGADINELAVQSPVGAAEFSRRSLEALALIENLGKPVIAAVNGFALGGGCELAMACHIRIASASASFGQPEVSLGIIPGNGGTQRLARLVGKGRAIEIVLTGAMVDAQEAYRIGLVNKVVPPENLLAAAKEMAGKIMTKGPVAVRLSLQAIHHGMEMSLREGLELEANLFGLVFSTDDMKEGTRAFLERRKPQFKGE